MLKAEPDTFPSTTLCFSSGSYLFCLSVCCFLCIYQFIPRYLNGIKRESLLPVRSDKSVISLPWLFPWWFFLPEPCPSAGLGCLPPGPSLLSCSPGSLHHRHPGNLVASSVLNTCSQDAVFSLFMICSFFGWSTYSISFPRKGLHENSGFFLKCENDLKISLHIVLFDWYLMGIQF